MQGCQTAEVAVGLRTELLFLPVATSCVEKAARAFDLGDEAALALTLAAEEVFAYLCRTAAPGSDVRMLCRGRGYYVELDFLFQSHDFDLRAFNLTASASFEDHACMEEAGLLIASRMVDRFRFFEGDGGVRLVLIKEKSYPTGSDLHVPEPRPLTEFVVRLPDPEEMKTLVVLTGRRYGSHSFPATFAFPGKLVDMVASGEFRAIIAADRAGHVGGGLIWRSSAGQEIIHRDRDTLSQSRCGGQSPGRLVEFFGPYLFNQSVDSPMARELLDFCISAVARTKAVGLINRYPTPELPVEYFESLGYLSFRQGDGEVERVNAYHRLLQEDPGLSVWAHPCIEGFLTREYRRLVFAREIRLVTDQGESQSAFSVFSARLDREAGRATLRPVWWGRDVRETLQAHVDTLLKEGLPNILFGIDLGHSWHCHFAPALLAADFLPRLVLPYGGKGDLLVFQHAPGEKPSW